MRKLIWSCLFLAGCWAAGTEAFAAEPSAAQAAVAGSTVKTLARAFVAAANLDEVKNNTIVKMGRMSPVTYRKQYAKHYQVLKDLPAGLKKKYGIVEDLSRVEMIKIIRSLDKKQVYTIIEAIPNVTIAREVEAYFHKEGKDAPEMSFTEKVQALWQDIVVDMSQKPMPAR